jgi:putative oxygen-independent coproporphyrinogen III oxidase
MVCGMPDLILPPLSLYVHIPWCVKKCPYCDFNSHQCGQELPEAAYIAALLDDLQQDKQYAQDRTLKSIFIGGGTPSLFHPSSIATLLTGIQKLVPLDPDCEITMEANPGTLERHGFAPYRAAGVTRLSMGIQSFNNRQLSALGRIHNAEQAKQAIIEAKQAGFKSYNLDLMHGLPQQSIADALADLDQAIAWDAPHLSWYQLTIEPQTQFYSQPPKLPDDETLWTIYEQGQQRLAAAGYQAYEISGYAKPGFACQHNLNYWRFGDYIGIGCGAHGKITLPQQQQIIRTTKIKHPKGYLPSLVKMHTRQPIAARDCLLEFMMNYARLHAPIPYQDCLNYTGLALPRVQQALEQGARQGFIKAHDEHWHITPHGRLFMNEFLQTLMD